MASGTFSWRLCVFMRSFILQKKKKQNWFLVPETFLQQISWFLFA